jgi:hypothetical protein
MLPEDKFFRSDDKKIVWQRYCGFLDLSLQEFMEIQKQLLLEQLELVARSLLGERIMKGAKPKTVKEFRQLVPLTTYDDYAPYLDSQQEDALAMKPCFWVHTSGRGGKYKWAPWSPRAEELECRDIIGAFILASATKRGEVNLQPGARVLTNLPPRPYVTGTIISSMAQRISFNPIPPIEISETMEFQERIEKGFTMALRTGIDFFCSLSGVLIRVGEGFAEEAGRMKFSFSMLHPLVLFRLFRAWLRSKTEKRGLLPKDLWPVKALISWGTDAAIYKDRIAYYWGETPYELYAATELGFIAAQAWNKRGMTFFADSVFLEFIPEAECIKSREDKEYQPATVLLDEVEEGKIYEIVITNFYGMPFLRYRLGDLIKIVALRDEETGVNLPQMVFQARVADIIDIAGFTILDEKTVWQAIANTGIRYEDWTARKEYEHNEPILHLYIELRESARANDVKDLVNEALKAIDQGYKDLDSMLEVQPLRVTCLSKGTFQRYFEEKKRGGVDLAQLKPAHMNTSDAVIRDLLRLSEEVQ